MASPYYKKVSVGQGPLFELQLKYCIILIGSVFRDTHVLPMAYVQLRLHALSVSGEKMHVALNPVGGLKGVF